MSVKISFKSVSIFMINIHENGEIQEDVTHMVKAGSLKWRNASRVLCNHKITLKLEGRFYRAAIRPIILYDFECWVIKTYPEK